MRTPQTLVQERFEVSAIGHTPITRIAITFGTRTHIVHMKLEGENPGGSAKDRTAKGLMDDLIQRRLVQSDSVVVESTSGNLGVSLAHVAAANGLRLLAVIDPKATPHNVERMRAAGADLVLIDEADQFGGYLDARIAYVRSLCDGSTRYVWANQYSSHANPRAHYFGTGLELATELPDDVDAVFVAASTGGTLAGIAQRFREIRPHVRIIGVDAVGSIVFGGQGAPRTLVGIGSSQPSRFITSGLIDDYMLVTDSEAYEWCHAVVRRIGLYVGGSTGAVVAAVARYLDAHPSTRSVACVSADAGANYEATIYNDAWLRGALDTSEFDMTALPSIECLDTIPLPYRANEMRA